MLMGGVTPHRTDVNTRIRALGGPVLNTAPAVTTTAKVELAPRLRAEATRLLTQYQTIKEQLKIQEHALKQVTQRIQDAFDQAGELALLDQGVAIGNCKLKVVTGVYATLDRALLIQAGCTPELLEECTVTKPKRPYLKVTTPGGRDDE